MKNIINSKSLARWLVSGTVIGLSLNKKTIRKFARNFSRSKPRPNKDDAIRDYWVNDIDAAIDVVKNLNKNKAYTYDDVSHNEDADRDTDDYIESVESLGGSDDIAWANATLRSIDLGYNPGWKAAVSTDSIPANIRNNGRCLWVSIITDRASNVWLLLEGNPNIPLYSIGGLSADQIYAQIAVLATRYSIPAELQVYYIYNQEHPNYYFQVDIIGATSPIRDVLLDEVAKLDKKLYFLTPDEEVNIQNITLDENSKILDYVFTTKDDILRNERGQISTSIGSLNIDDIIGVALDWRLMWSNNPKDYVDKNEVPPILIIDIHSRVLYNIKIDEVDTYQSFLSATPWLNDNISE